MSKNTKTINLSIPVTIEVSGEFGADRLASLLSEVNYETEHTHNKGSAILSVRAPSRKQVRETLSSLNFRD